MKVIKRIIFLLIIGNCFAQPKFQADFDYSLFHYDDSTGLLELYYSFYKNTMSNSDNDGQVIVRGELFVDISRADDNSSIFQNSWEFDSRIDSSNPSDQTLLGLLRFELPAGNYICLIKGRDLNSAKSNIDSALFNIEVKELSSLRFSVSDIQLAVSINQYSTDENSLFYKNTLEILPNPSSLYGEASPVLYFYAELYNVDTDIKSEVLKIEHLLYNSRNEIVFRKTKYIPRKSSSVVEIGAINILKMPSGAYNLTFTATDTLKNLTIASARRVYLFNPGVIDTAMDKSLSMDFFASELSTMYDEELDDIFGYSKYIAVQNEIDAWARLSTDEGKRKFLYDFWKKRDQDPSTPENEFKKEYFEKVDYCNRYFSDILNKKGWRSDRGRVYLIYGKPSEIERHPNETDAKPYEIWYYEDIEGRVIFVFADFSGFSDYRLVHSTKRGELSNVNWYESLVRE